MPAIETLGRGHGALRGQDRHAHAQPDVGPHASASAAQVARRPSRRLRRCPEAFHELVEFGDPRQPARPVRPDGEGVHAARRAATSPSTEHLHADWTLVREYPLSPELLAMSHVWQSPRRRATTSSPPRGRPEAIADLCHLRRTGARRLGRRRSPRWPTTGCACSASPRATFAQPALPGEQHDFAFEFLGLVGLGRPGPADRAARRSQECYTAGIRVVMITGDYPGTARNIARQIGLDPPDEVITGPELDAMDDADLPRADRGRRTSSPASCPSRSCGWSTR